MLDIGWMIQSTSVVTGKTRQDPEVFDLTIEAIHELLEVGFAKVGDAVKDDRGKASVSYWDRPPEAAIAEIRERWKKHDESDRDFIVWLELTQAGRQEAERLDAAGCDPLNS